VITFDLLDAIVYALSRHPRTLRPVSRKQKGRNELVTFKKDDVGL